MPRFATILAEEFPTRSRIHSRIFFKTSGHQQARSDCRGFSNLFQAGPHLGRSSPRTLCGQRKPASAIWYAIRLIKDCGAQLVVIITCDSLKFGEQLARFTNVIAGHQAITPSSALSWAKLFYQSLSVGMPLFQAFDKAQDAADLGLVLLARKDIRFRRVS